MPLHNLQLLLRPTPGGLQDHHSFLSTQADLSLRSDLFSDLVILTLDGPVSCHQSLLAPLSPLLHSLLSSYQPFPGLVHTVVIPISLLTVKNILQIIYTGMVSVRNRTDMEAVLAGLHVLGIHLPGLECYQSAGHTYTARGFTAQPRSSRTLDFSLPRVRKDDHENNNSVRMNNIPFPFSALSVPQSSSSLHSSIVKLPNYGQVFQDVKPNNLSSLLPAPTLGLVDLQTQLASQLLPLAIDESVQCNVTGCRVQVSLQSLVEHFKDHQEHQFEAFKCDVCHKGFKHKKALEIHRIKDHDHFIENPLFINEAIANDPERELDDELCDNYTAIEGNPRKSKKSLLSICNC
jgi:aspartate carbamoyltransferase regulatory subunit